YILITYGRDDEEYQRSMLARASNALLEVSGIKATFTVGRVSKTQVAVSARSSKDINVQVIMEEMGGGGHFGMAATSFENKSVKEVIEILENTLDDYLA
ncbi:MAG: DHHA1 domain-containing protein, partial [Erysipelotrichaceae bacterium]|nr:DHHA1 domain-containing protein [Erysipelotrichaceae bacterium]